MIFLNKQINDKDRVGVRVKKLEYFQSSTTFVSDAVNNIFIIIRYIVSFKLTNGSNELTQ